jgi:hypothetical protein
MTRDEALEKLEESPYDPDIIQQDFHYIATKLRISSEELRNYLNMPKKFYWDYPNNEKYFEIGGRILARVAGTKRGGAY